MSLECPYCTAESLETSESRRIVRIGRFFRTSDAQSIQRFRCRKCRKTFSDATSDPCFMQKKRHRNEEIERLLCSGVSMRKTAFVLRLNKNTVVSKFIFLAQQASHRLEAMNAALPKVVAAQFDDMVSFEHTKCKPLSITLMVEQKTRRILGVEVSRMPANGKLAAISRSKYGPRRDERTPARRRLFERMASVLCPGAVIRSDMSPHYPADVQRMFPQSPHKVFKGRRGCIVGQGELKRGGFDPLFSLNQTCATIRDNTKRLARRTWCTTKRPDRLHAHLIMYAAFHNEQLIQKKKRKQTLPLSNTG